MNRATPGNPPPGSTEAGGEEVVDRLRSTYRAGITRPASWRRDQLGRLRRLLIDGEDEILEALRLDLTKPRAEAYMSEIGLTISEIRYMERHLDDWMAPRRVKVPWKLRPASARIMSEPLGVVLVIAPWNLPVQLLLIPLATALAAGNAVVVKPSEITPRVSSTMKRLITQHLDERAVAVVEGGVEETTALLEQRFDHILYTGSTEVGRVVMSAAARHLTPVTLELGGKSPAIVGPDANLEVAARRIVFGRFANAGQSCIAPDYVLVHRKVERALVGHLVAALQQFYGDDPRASPDFMRIVNQRHWRRLKALLDAGGYESIACGGGGDESGRYLEPTILTGVDPDAAVMREEIFGPVLPVIGVDDIDAAIEHVNRGEKPLALYVFSENGPTVDHVLASTSSGGVCINGTVFQVIVPDLPFGGVGASGMGAYHGRQGFDTFSHQRSVLTRSTRLDPAAMYPPMTALKEKMMRRFS